MLREQKIDGRQLPDYEAVRRYLGPAGMFLRSEDDGWFASEFCSTNRQPMSRASTSLPSPRRPRKKPLAGTSSRLCLEKSPSLSGVTGGEGRGAEPQPLSQPLPGGYTPFWHQPGPVQSPKLIEQQAPRGCSSGKPFASSPAPVWPSRGSSQASRRIGELSHSASQTKPWTEHCGWQSSLSRSST